MLLIFIDKVAEVLYIEWKHTKKAGGKLIIAFFHKLNKHQSEKTLRKMKNAVFTFVFDNLKLNEAAIFFLLWRKINLKSP